MSPGTSEDCRSTEVVADDGASVRFCAHGGHVLGWTPAGGQERLWLSRSTGCGPGTAVRGGVPVVWPQFAERGDGPRHGVARDRVWQVLQAGTEDGAATVRMRLTGDGTEPPVPHVFTLDLHVTAAGDTLRVRLDAVDDGTEPCTFTAALHTYLRVSSTAAVTLDGLDGLLATPNDGGPAAAVEGPLRLLGPLDVAVAGVGGGPVVLRDPVLGDLQMVAEGFSSRVVWNPGPGRAPGDVHPGGEAEFVCVEPAQLEPVTLAPGARWSASESLTVLHPPT